VLVAVGSKIILEGEQDWTGSRGIRGCLFCFSDHALNYVEERLEGRGHSAGGLKAMPIVTTLKLVATFEFQLCEKG
jgi:hypothetical protein